MKGRLVCRNRKGTEENQFPTIPKFVKNTILLISYIQSLIRRSSTHILYIYFYLPKNMANHPRFFIERHDRSCVSRDKLEFYIPNRTVSSPNMTF